MASAISTRADLLRSICLRNLRLTTVIRRNGSNLPERKDAPPVPTLYPGETGAVPVQQKLLARIPSEYHGVPSTEFNDETVWLTVFTFPYLGYSRSFMKIKVYFCVMSVGAFIYKIYNLLSLGHYSYSSMRTAAIWSLFSLGALCVNGSLFRTFIARIYVSKDLKFVRLSRFTFFAGRRDLVLPSECIIPLTESNSSNRPLILNLGVALPEDFDVTYDFYEFYENSFKICLKFGGVTDVEKFEHVFGKILTKKFF